jgi:hypothetical protein
MAVKSFVKVSLQASTVLAVAAVSPPESVEVGTWGVHHAMQHHRVALRVFQIFAVDVQVGCAAKTGFAVVYLHIVNIVSVDHLAHIQAEGCLAAFRSKGPAYLLIGGGYCLVGLIVCGASNGAAHGTRTALAFDVETHGAIARLKGGDEFTLNLCAPYGIGRRCGIGYLHTSCRSIAIGLIPYAAVAAAIRGGPACYAVSE